MFESELAETYLFYAEGVSSKEFVVVSFSWKEVVCSCYLLTRYRTVTCWISCNYSSYLAVSLSACFDHAAFHTVHRVSENSQNCFCHNFVNFSPILIIFGAKRAKTIELCKVHLFSTSPNLCQHTAM